MTRERITLPIDNLGCGGGGALAIERALTQAPGVMQAYVNPLTEMAYIVYDPAEANGAQLAAVIERFGNGAPPAIVPSHHAVALVQTPPHLNHHSTSPRIALERNTTM